MENDVQYPFFESPSKLPRITGSSQDKRLFLSYELHDNHLDDLVLESLVASYFLNSVHSNGVRLDFLVFLEG